MPDITAGMITTADLYRELRSISDGLIRMEARVQVNSSMVGDHEARLRLLERFRYTLMGVAIAAGTAAGVASSLIAGQLHLSLTAR